MTGPISNSNMLLAVISQDWIILPKLDFAKSARFMTSDNRDIRMRICVNEMFTLFGNEPRRRSIFPRRLRSQVATSMGPMQLPV